MVNAFEKILIKKDFLAIVLRLRKGVTKRKSFNYKNLLISLWKDSILLLYIVWIVTMIVIIAKVIIVVIDSFIKKSIANNDI